MNHPIHPLLVHFPIACWSLSTLGDLATIFLPYPLVPIISLLLFVGCITAIIAMSAGLYEVSKIKDIESIQKTVDMHMYAAVLAWCFYCISLYFRWDNHFVNEFNLWATSTSVIGFISLMVAGWYGGILVYRHGVGTSNNKSL